jgi:hypothetical protein
MSPRLGDLRSYDQLLDLLADELLREILADSEPKPRPDIAGKVIDESLTEVQRRACSRSEAE